MLIRILMMLALFLPIAAWSRWRQTNKVSYMGPALFISFLPSGFEGKVYAVLQIPGRADHPIVLVAKPGNDELKYLGKALSIVEERRFMGRSRVVQINWTGEKLEPTEPEFGAGMFITLLYLAMALGVGVLTSNWELGTFGYLSSALAIAIGGACVNLFRFSPQVTRSAPMRLLGLPVGKGMLGLSIGAVVLAAITVACFWQVSIFTFFPGINCAFELGGVTAMLIAAQD
jgi:hypothetical protein